MRPPSYDYSSFHNGIVHSLCYGRMSVFHLKDLHPAAAVWEASPESLVHSALPRLSSALLCAENGFCSCVADKIEEAQKELKDPKGSQKGKRSLIKTCNFQRTARKAFSFIFNVEYLLFHHLRV